jgi:hypothetical protein
VLQREKFPVCGDLLTAGTARHQIAPCRARIVGDKSLNRAPDRLYVIRVAEWRTVTE